MLSELDELLTPEQQALLARHLSERVRAKFGNVVIQIHKGKVYRIGQEFLEDADPRRLTETFPAVMPVAKRRR